MSPPASQDLIAQLRGIVGIRHVLTGRHRAASYATGFRAGGRPAAMVVRPGSLVELWRAFKACIGAAHVVIVQAANTGLTGGSTPFGEYDRPVAVIDTMRIGGIVPIGRGEQEIETQIVGKLYYGHFLCHVFHQDYLVKKGVDPHKFEHGILELLDRRGAEYPAGHNVGLYVAKPVLAEHYRRLDPSNQMNPGIGGTSRCQAHG